MMHFLAQSGSGGGWFTSSMIRALVPILVLSFAGLGALIKKINENRAKRNAELRRQQREEQVLRTGRPDGSASTLR